MLHDITDNVRIIEEKIEHILYCMEYVYGFRFDLTVGPDGINLEQDTEFNRENFGKILDLQEMWNKLKENYNLSEESLKYGPIQYYTLRCIYYDDDLDGVVKYPNARGIVVVEAQQLGSNNLIPASKLNEFCARIGLIGLKPIFEGNLSLFRGKYEHLQDMLVFSSNGASRGFIIVPDPCVINPLTLEFDRYFIGVTIDDINKRAKSENPSAMAQELTNYLITLDLVTELEIKYAISPVRNKTKFLNKLVDFICTEYNDFYTEYFNKCSSNLSLDFPDKEFKTLIKQYSKDVLTNIILSSDTYKYQSRS